MRPQNGFTLIELMVTLVVLAIVISIAVPSFSGMLRDNRNLTMRNELASAIQLARSEAVKRRSNVVLCRSNTDRDDCSNGTNWNDGWLIKVQLNTDPVSYAAARVWEGSGSVVIEGPEAGLTFQFNGMTTATDKTDFSVFSSSCSSPKKHQLTVSRTGSTSTKQVDCL